jgi:hypothetical protein
MSKENIMSIVTDYTVHTESQRQQRELARRLELRRRAAERGVEKFGGRLAFASHLALRARAAHAGVAV